MNEKQLLDRLKREADTVSLPETLSPEAIERMLLAAQKNQAAQSKNPTEPASAQSAASSDTGSPHTKGGSNMKKHTSFYPRNTAPGTCILSACLPFKSCLLHLNASCFLLMNHATSIIVLFSCVLIFSTIPLPQTVVNP